MIKTNVKQFVGLLVLLALLFIGLEKALVTKELNNRFDELQAERATLVSRVNLLIADNHINTRQGLSSFLTELESITEIDGWQLIDDHNNILSEKNSPNERSTPQYLYFYSDPAHTRLISLKLFFEPLVPETFTWSLTETFFVVFLVAAILFILYRLFKWVIQVEKYATYLLKETIPVQKIEFSQQTNPVSQIINQLMLKNSLLVKDKNELTEQIRKISYVDEVTELGNQHFFKAEFQVRLHNHGEDESGLLVLLSFREFDPQGNLILDNDKLRAIANVISQFANGVPKALAARLRENDFTLLLPNQTRDRTNQICKTLIEQLDKSIFDKTSIKEHFVDIGISAYKQGFDYYKIVAEADMALRNSQLQGGNNWFMYGEALADNRVRGHIRWRSFLQRVLDKRQLQLYGQKVHFFDDRKIDQQEVLVRIEDGNEILTAETFLPMANSCGLAIEFDRQVVDGVIKHCLYQEKGEVLQRYSINLFITSLLDDKFIGWLLGKLSSYPEMAKQIIFEVSENHVNQNYHKLRMVMNQLAELGVSWCIERFGSPNEKLTYLNLLPIESVKIDRRIIYDIHENKAQQLLLQSLKLNLKSLNILVIAEGVENLKDAEYLAKSGVDAGQGFFYSKPKRMKRVEKYLKAV